jgi:hypothetical protein
VLYRPYRSIPAGTLGLTLSFLVNVEAIGLPQPPHTIEKGNMQTNQKRSFAMALVFCFLALTLAARTSGFEDIRPVQMLLLFAAGLNGGVALSILRVSIKTKA